MEAHMQGVALGACGFARGWSSDKMLVDLVTRARQFWAGKQGNIAGTNRSHVMHKFIYK